MSIATSIQPHASSSPLPAAVGESAWVRRTLIAIALGFISLVLLMPLVLVFTYAFGEGLQVYLAAIRETDSLSAIRLTLITAAIVVPLNTVFGVAAAWAIAKFDFRGKSVLITIIDLPFAISPVVVGMIFILLFGARGWFGPTLSEWGIQIIFTPLAIIIVSAFGTMPFVVRELIPLMQAQGTEEEQSALTLGASGFQTFWRITLPNIKWGLIYGVILCNARAMGEFGSVYVVSGRIRGETNTMPLHIEVLYNDYMFTASFAVASLLAMLALVTLVVKSVVEWKIARDLAIATRESSGE
ncbi:sulfate ABC transporter permease subunit CysW [Phycisphaerales bacterium AB-hyl4]|uniref:Sulfate ABC transporter permease subunit CysW n=1 Tax=Natronomicrosphaera hydrolytica TaxID=3242702 RepID=A0ABV4U367_9BACT